MLYSLRYLLIILNLSLLNGCAINSSTKSWKSSVPKVPAKQLPGGSADTWRYLGSTNLVAVEINESSISTNANFDSFQDRKTVIEPNKLNYQGTAYKYALSWWQLNCTHKQYLINATSLYDSFGKLITTYPLTTNWSTIASGSIAELQYNYLCQGTNRTLGY